MWTLTLFLLCVGGTQASAPIGAWRPSGIDAVRGDWLIETNNSAVAISGRHSTFTFCSMPLIGEYCFPGVRQHANFAERGALVTDHCERLQWALDVTPNTKGVDVLDADDQCVELSFGRTDASFALTLQWGASVTYPVFTDDALVAAVDHGLDAGYAKCRGKQGGRAFLTAPSCKLVWALQVKRV